MTTTSVRVGDDFYGVGRTIHSIKSPMKVRKDLQSRYSEADVDNFVVESNLELSPRAPKAEAGGEYQAYHRPIIKSSRSVRRGAALHPASPCSGVSEECIAMVNACSHDHDYVSAEKDVGSPRYKFSGKEISRRHSMSPGIIVKRDPDAPITASHFGVNNGGRSPKVPTRFRSRRIVLVRKVESAGGSVVRPVVPEKLKVESRGQVFAEQDTKCDENTTLSFITASKSEISSEVGGDEIVHSGESSPRTRDRGNSKSCTAIERGFDVDITSPRPSMTPFPPAERRRSRQGSAIACKREEINTGGKDSDFEHGGSSSVTKSNDNCKASVDSAYSSLSYSTTSVPPRTPSGNRPPSGGKRGATCGLTSSSSSGTSSDEWSDIESPVKLSPGEGSRATESGGRGTSEETRDDDCASVCNTNSTPPENLPLCPPRLQRKTSAGKKIKKYSEPHETAASQPKTEGEKLQFTPTPPTRKPKRSRYYRSVPMRLRALPRSFWEEPNRTNPSPYTILPPVQPLFHQQENEDFADIRPVTPPNEKESNARQSAATAGYDGTRHRTIIRTGDTDLLLRLFDKVEAKQNPTGIRAKRGRPKRPSYCAIPAPRRAVNDNPCIINSITEKLFPKLTLDNRHPVAAMITSSAVMSSGLSSRPSNEHSSEETNSKVNPGGKLEYESGIDWNPFLTDDEPSSSSLAFGAEAAMELTSSSPSPTLQSRPSPILPQLVMQKEYSQLLNELAAVL